MTALTWPSSLIPASCDIGLKRQTVQHQSQITSQVQAVELGTEFWRMNVTMPARARSESGEMEAFFNQLVGGVQTVSAWHFSRPIPKGTMRGSPTLAAGAAQFSRSLSMANCWGVSGANLLIYSEQFNQSAWVKTGGSITSTSMADPMGGTSADRFVQAAGTATHSLWQDVSAPVATPYAASCFVKPDGAARYIAMTVEVLPNRWSSAVFDLTALSASGTPQSGPVSGLSIQAAGGGFCRISMVANAYPDGSGSWTQRFGLCVLPSGSWTSAISPINSGSSFAADGTSGLTVWGAMLSSGALRDYQATGSTTTPPGTLLAGDMFNAGGQLFQAAANAAADTSGNMTVQTVNRVRTALSSGAAVAWYRPSSEFMVVEDQSAFTHGVDGMAPSSFTLIEAP